MSESKKRYRNKMLHTHQQFIKLVKEKQSKYAQIQLFLYCCPKSEVLPKGYDYNIKKDNLIDIKFTHWKVTQSLSKGRLSLQLEIDGQQKVAP